MARLANEAGTVQYPLVRHVEEVGWTVVSQDDALHRRGGEAGLFFESWRSHIGQCAVNHSTHGSRTEDHRRKSRNP